VFADPYGLSSINERSSGTTPLFSNEKPLTENDKQALNRAQDWINADQYPFREGDSVTYLYGGGQATVVCAPLRLCIVELEPGEKVVQDGIHLGDTARWMITPAIGAEERTHLVIKPIEVGLETSLAVVTDRRTYHMRLISRRDDYMPIIAFNYPETINAQWESYYARETEKQQRQTISETGENIAELDFEYEIEGCRACSWRPLRVYNNGVQTIIQMGKGMKQTEAPALLVKADQEEQLVNYRVIQDRYIVDQVFNEAVLIAGVGNNQNRVTIRRID
jgi:type IV secretion system protein VirB9